MNTVKVSNNKVKMIAHRGLSGIELENTAAAFVAAGNRSYYGIETDVHATADGRFVVIHDESTKRVSNEDINVETSSYEEVRRIRLNSSYGNGRDDLIIPNLREYIDICKRYEKICILEVKNTFNRENIIKMIKIIKEADYLENVIFISFSLENMILLREELPKQDLQFLCSKFNENILNDLNRYSLDLDINCKALTKDIVDIVHKNGHMVNCWTVNDAEAADNLIACGVDFITTNILE